MEPDGIICELINSIRQEVIISKNFWLGLIFSSVSWLNESWAGTVRTVYSDGVTMLPIYLRMGQSSVLRFTERPKKVVLGNSNYYSVEFIDNDLALQPLGAVTTNLFVYGQKYVYGFILKTNQGASYDDLVQVDLKENKQTPRAEEKRPLLKDVSKPKIIFTVGKALKVTLAAVKKFSGANGSASPYVFDLLLENFSRNKIDLKTFRLELWNGKVKFSPQEIIFRDEKLNSGEMTTARIFAATKKRSDLVLHVAIQKQSTKVPISGRFL